LSDKRLAIWDNDQALGAIVNLIAVLADNKYYFGRALSEWAVGAPTLENSVGCAAIAQEELGHCRALYPLLNELPFEGGPTPLEREADRARRYCVGYLNEPLPTWPHMVAALALIDTATLTLIEALVGSAYGNLARRVSRMPGEERFHMDFVEGRVNEIASFDGGLTQLSEQVQWLLPEMLCWFGPQGEPGVEVLKRESLLAADNEEMRQSYLDRVAPMLQEAGVELAVHRDDRQERWEYGELPWKKWNALQRCLRDPASIAKT
jgi:1,2-phenylacetyl-CoA epoxidase catalytic subunit